METLETTKTTWKADMAHSSLDFSVKHMMISTVKGLFKNFDIDVLTNGDHFDHARITVEVPIDGIDTNQPQRNDHLKSPDFFDAANYPKATFKSSTIEKTEDNNFRVHGDLTIRDITRPVILDVEYNGIATDPYGNTKAGFDFKTSINRNDFGLNWNAPLESGGVMVSHTVKISGGIQLLKQKDAAAQ